MPSARLVGAGRAGTSLARALAAAGWTVDGPLARDADVTGAAEGVDLLVLAVPDAAIAAVAAAVRRVDTTVVAHLAGSLGLDVLHPHLRRASIHPLAALPDAAVGTARLTGGGGPERRGPTWFAVAGDPLAAEVVAALGGRVLEVPDDRRASYHAAATIASNHLVALLGQVERVAADAGVPLEAYLGLARDTVEDVAALGPGPALTGPVSRGDWDTVARHLAVLAPAERRAYEGLAAAAERLVAGARSAARRPGVRVVDSIAALRKELDDERASGRAVGLVPTMGYLHDGHASLMARAREECDVVVASIFVNPLQFAPGDDLASYPRDLDRDRAVAARAGVDLLFVPNVGEMYPEPVLTGVSVANLSEPMEGDVRPGHFTGVATVVAKLFAVVGPCRAYFGEKDYQQLAVVRRMAADLSFPVEVVACPIVREGDGLALSSRNVYLAPEEREAATVLYRALVAGAAAIEAGERDPAAVRARMGAILGTEPLAQIDYAEVVDAHDLTVPESLAGDVRLLVAARIGRARLIDNLGVSL